MYKIEDLINTNHKNTAMSYNWDFIEGIKEFNDLKHTEQNPKWHSEGNAFIHTKNVCDWALSYVNGELSEAPSRPVAFLLAALFHDIGKATTTKIGKDGQWHSYGHERVSAEMFDQMVEGDAVFKEFVKALIELHMTPLTIFDGKNYINKIETISSRLNGLQTLVILKKCDVLGSKPLNKNEKPHSMAVLKTLKEVANGIGCYYTHNKMSTITKEEIEKKIEDYYSELL